LVYIHRSFTDFVILEAVDSKSDIGVSKSSLSIRSNGELFSPEVKPFPPPRGAFMLIEKNFMYLR